MLGDIATGAVADGDCSGASEKVSAVDAKEGVFAVAVALRLSGGAEEVAAEENVGWNSCVGVVKVSVEVNECVSVGISASWPSRAAVCPLICS